MNESATVVVSVQARGATATFAVDLGDPTEVRQFAQFALTQAMRGDTVQIEATDEWAESRPCQRGSSAVAAQAVLLE
jgi:hypothetical protein